MNLVVKCLSRHALGSDEFDAKTYHIVFSSWSAFSLSPTRSFDAKTYHICFLSFSFLLILYISLLLDFFSVFLDSYPKVGAFAQHIEPRLWGPKAPYAITPKN